LPDLPVLADSIENWEDFRSELIRAARTATAYVGDAARMSFPRGVDEVERAVVRAHMVRLYKLLDGYVTLLEQGRRDVAPVLCRTMMEIIINLEYLLNGQNAARLSRAFVCRSADHLLKPLKYLQFQIVLPEDRENPSEEDIEAVVGSIGPIIELGSTAAGMLQWAGLVGDGDLAEDYLASDEAQAYLSDWPWSISGRVQTETAQAIFNVWFSRYSLTTHPNWMTLESQDIWMGDGGSARLEDSIPEIEDLADPPAWCIDTALRFAALVDSGQSVQLRRDLIYLKDYFLGAVDLNRCEFERALGECDLHEDEDFPETEDEE